MARTDWLFEIYIPSFKDGGVHGTEEVEAWWQNLLFKEENTSPGVSREMVDP